jgi:hypothetical protein
VTGVRPWLARLLHEHVALGFQAHRTFWLLSIPRRALCSWSAESLLRRPLHLLYCYAVVRRASCAFAEFAAAKNTSTNLSSSLTTFSRHETLVDEIVRLITL